MKVFIRFLLSLGVLLGLLLLQTTIFSSGDPLLAQAAEQNTQNESHPTNNMTVANRSVITDTEPPVVNQFVIANGAFITNQLTVTLEITATDPISNGMASGLQSLKFIEFEYNLDTHRWVPVQDSEWIDYDTIGEGYTWTFVPTYGMRYMQAWVADKAGNISMIPGTDVINLLPSEQAGFVRKHGVAFYRIIVKEGESFTAKLTPVDGDPDLYVWAANGTLSYDQPQTGIEEVSFEAPAHSIYQVEVHGFTDSDYQLEFNSTDSRATNAILDDPLYRTSGRNRIRQTRPVVPLDEWPPYYEDPTVYDPAPLTVDDFVIANGASTTNQLTVTLEVTATSRISNAIRSIKFIEYEYDLDARRWLTVQESDSIAYDTISEGYTWKLRGYGMRYMHAWVTDEAGNTSFIPGTDMINLLPADEAGDVSENGIAFYRVTLSPGETLTATLTSERGDADLYVWDSVPSLQYSNAYTGTDIVRFHNSLMTQTYQIEVHGFTDAEYKLTFDRTTDEQKQEFPPQGSGPKPVPQEPAAPLHESPSYYQYPIDIEPPVVDDFVIANGTSTIMQPDVTLDVTATDPNTSNGVQSIKFIEFEYILGAHRWVPVQRTPWMDYEIAKDNYPWTFVSTYGMRYMQAWAADNAGNISSQPGVDVINLLPTDQPGSVEKNGIVFYRVPLSQGETFAAWLTPESGDPDLYIWGANGQLWHSNAYTGTDSVTFQAPFTGIYQIEVHGFTDSEYKLTFGATSNEQRQANPTGGNEPKPLPQEPGIPLDDWPEFYELDPLPPIRTLYLPLMMR